MMPRHRLISLALVILWALTSIQLTGCTAIGFGVGALADMSSGKRSADRLVTVHTGTRVTLWLRDGRKLHGQYMGSRDSLSESPALERPIGGERSMARPGTVLLLGTSHGIEQIPIQDVSRVSVPVARGKVIGLVSGLAVDGVLLVLFFLALSQIDFS
jgi:hypothetical protein